jgi:two-component SAPR family response regulator
MVGDAEVRLREKEFELVALLASTRVPLSRDQIGEALWDHLDSAEWSNNLKVTLYRVRRAMGLRDVTVLEGPRYRLAPGIDVDLRRAEAFVRDLGSDDHAASDADELRAVIESFGDGVLERYERYAWSHTLVARLNDLACACGLAVAAQALAQGRFDDALAYAARVRAVDHLNEKACAITVRCACSIVALPSPESSVTATVTLVKSPVIGPRLSGPVPVTWNTSSPVPPGATRQNSRLP